MLRIFLFRTSIFTVFIFAFCLIANTTQAQTEVGTPETSAQFSARLKAEVSAAVLRYPAGQIKNAELADSAANETDVLKSTLVRWNTVATDECYDRFFVNACLYSVKSKQRELSTAILSISVEAKTLQRKRRVEEMDRNLAQKRQEAEQKTTEKSVDKN